MTTYVGVKWESIKVALAYDNPALGNFPLTREHNYAGHVVLGNTNDGAGARTGTQPVDEPRTLRAGGERHDMFGTLDFYNRIHVQYSLLDLGNIVSTLQRTIEVFNAYFEPRTLNDVTAVDDVGLTLTEPGATPLVYAPLETKVYELTVNAEGPPTVAAVYTFDFDVADFTLSVVGTRLVLFAFMPNGGIEETLEWKTDVIRAYDGSEQRIRVRTAPRQVLSFNVLTSGDEDLRLRGLLFDWLGRTFGVPLWFEMRAITTAATAGSDTVQVSTAYGDFRVGGLAMIFEEGVSEVLGVDSFDATSITFTTELGNNYSTRAVVMPVRVAYANSQVSRSRFREEWARTALSFVTVENEDLADTTGATLHDGRVFLTDYNFLPSTELQENFDQPVVVVDTESGRIYQTAHVDRAKMHSTKRWETESLADLWRIRRLLHAFRGSQKSFFLPVFRDDLTVSQTIAGGATTLRIVNVNYATFFAARRPYGDFRLTLTNGTTYTRQILSASVDGDEEVLTFINALDASPILTTQIARMEIINLVRIADDRARIKHEFNDGVATIDIRVCAVRE